MKSLISAATEKNWKRLGSDGCGCLTRRANKRASGRKFLPAEYLTDRNHRKAVQEILEQAEKHLWDTDRVLYSISVSMLRKKGIFQKPHVQAVLKEYYQEILPEIEEMEIPEGEWDFLGTVYQGMLTEGKKNQTGSYYTPEKTVKNMVREFDFSKGQIFLDPCCGSGSFLMAAEHASPEQLWGMDSDPRAVMLAKVNLLLKFPKEEFIPHICRGDFLKEENKINCRRFHYIATNPPWGAVSAGRIPEPLTYEESFSCFFVNAFRRLEEGGVIRFLFPESVLYIGAHRDLRKFMLDHCCIEQITRYQERFSGVATKYVEICCRKSPAKKELQVIDSEGKKQVPLSAFRETENYTFCFLTEEEMKIIHRMKALGTYDLSDSIWALGIVTGDNQNKLRETNKGGLEPIITGREIQRYYVKPAVKYLRYAPSELQQSAREEYYRAKEKLVYKFISDRLIFAYDDSGSLILNSGNILIPSVPHMGMKTVLAYLNSELFQFFYRKCFQSVKVLKGNLLKLPFPEISEKQNQKIEDLVNRILAGEQEADDRLQKIIFEQYGLTEVQIQLIREENRKK